MNVRKKHRRRENGETIPNVSPSVFAAEVQRVTSGFGVSRVEDWVLADVSANFLVDMFKVNKQWGEICKPHTGQAVLVVPKVVTSLDLLGLNYNYLK